MESFNQSFIDPSMTHDHTFFLFSIKFYDQIQFVTAFQTSEKSRQLN